MWHTHSVCRLTCYTWRNVQLKTLLLTLGLLWRRTRLRFWHANTWDTSQVKTDVLNNHSNSESKRSRGRSFKSLFWVNLEKNKVYTDSRTTLQPHPMVDAVKQYILATTDRHVNLEKLLSVRNSQPKNFTYSTLLLKVCGWVSMWGSSGFRSIIIFSQFLPWINEFLAWNTC